LNELRSRLDQVPAHAGTERYRATFAS
jgi:hypothetical protein